MPDATPARLPLEQALDEGLAAMFRQLQAEPAPASLIRLVDRLDAAARRPGETRSIVRGRAHLDPAVVLTPDDGGT